MSFLWPWALLLSCIAVPLILLLHLLRNRREMTNIPSLLFWHGLEQQRQGGRPRQIPLSLLLLLQLLAAIALILGIAGPTLSFALNQPEQTIFVLDTTTSMAAIDVPQSGTSLEPVRRFDQAREIIRTHVQTMDENDSLALIGLASQPTVLIRGGFGQQQDIFSTLDSLEPGTIGADLTGALSLASGLVDPEQKNRIVVLTDGNYPAENQPLPAILAPLEWAFIPEANAPDINNQALLNVSARMLPDGRHRIFARVVNYGNAPAIRTLRLSANGDDVQEDTVNIEAEADATKSWTVPASAETVAVEIVEPDILPLDNRAELLLLDTSQRRVLLVSATPETLIKALEAQPGVELTVTTTGLDAYDLAEFDLVVVDGLLPVDLTAWPAGNLLVINPPLRHPLLPAEDYIRNVRPDLNSASSLLAGIELSGVYFSRAPRLILPDWARVDLVSTMGEAEQDWPLIFRGTIDASRVVVWAFDLTASNLPARLALPLLTANTLSALLAPSPPASVPVGEPVSLPPNFSVETPDGQRLFLGAVGSVRVDPLFTRTTKPGLYRIYDDSNTLVAGFAVHAGSPLESNLGQRQWQPDTLSAVESAVIPVPEPERDQEDFWPLLAGFALAVILMEGWLAWRK